VTTTDWRTIVRLVADGVGVTEGDRVSAFFTDVAVMDAVAAFVDECWRRGAVVQSCNRREVRLQRSAVGTPRRAVRRAPLEAAAMEWSDVHVSFRAMTTPILDADPARIAALRRGRGLVSTMRWQRTRWALVRVPTPQWAAAMALDADDVVREWGRPSTRTGPRRLAGCRRSATTSPLPGRGHRGRVGCARGGGGGADLDPLRGERELARRRDRDRAGRGRGLGQDPLPGRLLVRRVIVRDLELELVDGLIVAERATEGLAFVSALLDTDEGARRLGEFGSAPMLPHDDDR